MGKTVKSRLFISITAVVCVIVLCVIANSGIPSLYESYAERVAAQEAATRTTQQVKAPVTTTTEAPTTEPETTVTEPTTEEVPVTEETPTTTEPTTTEEVTEEETTTEPVADSSEESFLDKIINFFTSLIETLFSGDLISKIGDFFSGIFGGLGL